MNDQFNKDALSNGSEVAFGDFYFMEQPGMYPMGIISADYAEYDFSKSYKENNNHICDIFRQSMREYCCRTGETFHPIFEQDTHIIILWYNVPDPISGKVNLNKTLELLCKNKNFGGKIYIRSIKDVVTEGIDHLLHMITILFQNDRMYTFLDNDYFSFNPDAEDPDFANVKKLLDEKYPDGIDALIFELVQNVFRQIMRGKVISELDRLVPRPNHQPIDDFVEVYWKWQKVETAVDVCKKELDITHRTFYKYSQLYETTPYYCEHLKLYCDEIKDLPKRGQLPDKEEYLRDMYALELGLIEPFDVCKKYGVASEIDIQRIKQALTERRKKAK